MHFQLHCAYKIISTKDFLNHSSIQSQLAENPLPSTAPTMYTEMLGALTPLVSLHPTFPGLGDYGIRKIEGK